MTNDRRQILGFYTTHEEAFGQRATVQELITLLTTLSLPKVVRTVALVTATIADRSADQSVQVGLAQRLFSKSFLDRVDAGIPAARKPYAMFFHRPNLLFLMRLAILACPIAEGEDWSQDQNDAFGRAVLMVNDLYSGRPCPTVLTEETRPDLITALLPSVLYAGEALFNNIARSNRFWLEALADWRSEADGPADLLKFFEQRYGVTFEVFQGLLYLLTVWTSQFSVTDPLTTRSCLFINPNTFTGNSRITEEAFSKVMEVLACSPEVFAQNTLHRPIQAMSLDFTMFALSPFISLSEDEIVCFDRVFLSAYSSEGLYWLVNDCLPLPERNALGEQFGRVFERYIDQILSRIYPTSSVLVNRYSRGVKLESKLEIDGLIDSGDSLIIMEHKASRLTTRAKFSGDTEVLMGDLNSRFVQSTGNKPKGISQLSAIIKAMQSERTLTVPGLDLKGLKRIAPVLVCYEDVMAGPLITSYLDSRLRELLDEDGSGPVKVLPLVILTTRDIEALESLCRKVPMHELILNYVGERHEALSFWNYIATRYGDDLREEGTLAAESFKDALDRVGRDWFDAEQ